MFIIARLHGQLHQEASLTGWCGLVQKMLI